MEDEEFEFQREKFLSGLEKMQDGAYDVLSAWDNDKLRDIVHENEDFIQAFKGISDLSFDEWWHNLVHLAEVTKEVLQYELKTDDCVNCLVGNSNPHHGSAEHPRKGEDGFSRPCVASDCSAQCHGYYTARTAHEW